VQGSDISGALADDELTEADLAAGRYDAAAIEVFIVDWSDPTLNVLLMKGALGEVRREGAAFTAELRSLTHRLAEDSGRLYTATCNADLGDARCTIDLTNPDFRGSGTIATLEGAAIFHASGLGGFDDCWFTEGKISFTSGANDGLAVEVAIASMPAGDHRALAADARADRRGRHVRRHRRLRQALCDLPRPLRQHRQLPGLPHIPGNDFVISVPGPASGNSGRSLLS
jgi:hypothetical protein